MGRKKQRSETEKTVIVSVSLLDNGFLYIVSEAMSFIKSQTDGHSL